MTSQIETIQKIIHLQKKIKEYNHLYYNQNISAISDYEYDLVFRSLKKLEKKYSQLLPETITNKVGATVSTKLKKVNHKFQMLSLENAMNEEELLDFIQKKKKDLSVNEINFFLSLKYDGMALELVYRNGKLFQASTRGDGYIGEDVTANAKNIQNIPSQINLEETPFKENQEVIIRGEVILFKDDFLKLNQNRAEQELTTFSNPRNAAAGSLRQLKSDEDRKLNFFAYELICNETEIKTYHGGIEILQKWNFDTHQKHTFLTKDINQIKQFYLNYSEEKRNQLPFEIDGLVLKIDNLAYQNQLGVVGKRPRYAIAWKFPPTVKQTLLKNIEFQVGRTGVITPVGILEPIDINGATISRVTLHNKSEIQNKDIRIEDTVEIIRSGEVIPKILKVCLEKRKANSTDIIFPSNCPICQSKLIEEDILTYCNNQICPEKIKKSIIHFVSKSAMNMEGISSQMIEEWLQKKLIANIVDLYSLTEDDLEKMERIGDKLKQNILSSIQQSKKTTLNKFIYALGIKGVGERVSKQLAKKYETIEKILTLSKEELLDMDEIGENLSNDITSFFQKQQNKEMISKLLNAGLEISQTKSNSGIFDNCKILFTGTMQQPRRLLKEKAEANGAEIVSSISKNTTYLVVGENPGSKLKKAKELGIKIINEVEFNEMIILNEQKKVLNKNK